MNPDAQWFYEMGGSRQGPVSTGQMLSLRSGGMISDSTLVWTSGLQNWIPFSQSPLANQIVSNAPVSAPTHPVPSPPPAPIGSAPFVPRQARIRPDYRLSIRQTLGRSWTVLKSRFWPIIGVSLLAIVMMSVASQLIVTSFFLTLPLMVGLFWYLLNYLRGKEPNVEMLFEGFRRQFKSLAILNLILTVISIILCIPVVAVVTIGVYGALQGGEPSTVLLSGFIGGALLLYFLLIIAISFLGFVCTLASLLVIDCEISIKQALSMSWQVVKAQWLRFLLFFVAMVALSLAGALAFYVGLFVTTAWSMIAYVVIYEDAFGDKPQTV